MKLSEKTLKVLKTFADINSSLLFRKGTLQKTLHIDDVIIVNADLPDDFPVEFGIYDLSEFLANYSTMNNPDLTFSDTYLTMKDDNISLKYFYCAPNLIRNADKNLSKLDFTKPDATFQLDQNSFAKLMKVGQLNGFTHLTVNGADGVLTATMLVPGNDSSNSVTYEISDYDGNPFEVSFAVEYLKLIPAKYTVDFLKIGLARFTSEDGTLTYYIATHKKEKK